MKQGLNHCLFIFILVASSIQLLSQDEQLNRCNGIRQKVLKISKENDAVDQLSESSLKIYQKLIELTVLYYMNKVSEGQVVKVRYQMLVKDIHKEFLVLGKALLLYAPQMLRDKKTSWKVKLKQSVKLGCSVGVLYFWIREYGHEI